MEGRDDGAAADLPRLVVRGDEALAHDGLQDLRQDALCTQSGEGVGEEVYMRGTACERDLMLVLMYLSRRCPCPRGRTLS